MTSKMEWEKGIIGPAQPGLQQITSHPPRCSFQGKYLLGLLLLGKMREKPLGIMFLGTGGVMKENNLSERISEPTLPDTFKAVQRYSNFRHSSNS